MNDDTIYRQAAIAYAISGLTREFEGEKWIRVSEVRESLQIIPSTERLGQWEDIEHAPNGLLYVTCSVCGKRQTVEFTSYCGNCGAKMDLEDDEDE